MGKIYNERKFHLKCTGKSNFPLNAEKLVSEKYRNCVEHKTGLWLVIVNKNRRKYSKSNIN